MIPVPEGGWKNPDGTEWVPEFDGQRPPFQPGNDLGFEPGNTVSLKHGAGSPRTVEPLADEIIKTLLADPGLSYLHAPRFQYGLRRWATTEARRQLIERWIDSMTMQEAARSDRGQTSPLELYRRWCVTAGNDAKALGLDPLSHAKLGRYITTTRQADAATLLTQARLKAELLDRETDE